MARDEEQKGMLTTREATSSDGFGSKTINTFGSWCLLVNNITGPGLVVLANVFQNSGWVPAIGIIVLCAIIGGFSSLLLAESMTYIPGNKYFQGRVEYGYLCKKMLSRRVFLFMLAIFILNLMTTLVSSVIESSQVADSALEVMFGKTCALFLYPETGFKCISSGADDASDSPFGGNWVISIGYLVMIVIAIPLGYWNLDDNMVVQYFAFIGLVFIIMWWTGQFLGDGLQPDLLPAATSSQDGLVGTIFFNFAYIITVPSWINEKRPEVKMNSSIWGSTVIGCSMFIVVGLFGAMSYDFSSGDDLLAVLSRPNTYLGTRVVTFLFPLICLVTSIPIFSIILRYNLLENKLCGPMWANLWGVVFPWILSLAFYSGDLINIVVNWTGLLTGAILNFIVPCYVFIKCIEEQKARGISINVSMSTDSKYEPVVSFADDVADSDDAYQSLGTGESLKQYQVLPSWPRESVCKLCKVIIVAAVILNIVAIGYEIDAEATGASNGSG